MLRAVLYRGADASNLEKLLDCDNNPMDAELCLTLKSKRSRPDPPSEADSPPAAVPRSTDVRYKEIEPPRDGWAHRQNPAFLSFEIAIEPASRLQLWFQQDNSSAQVLLPY